MTRRSDGAAEVERLSGQCRSIAISLEHHADGLGLLRRTEARFLRGMAEQLAAVADRLTEVYTQGDPSGVRRWAKWVGVFVGGLLLQEVPGNLLSEAIIDQAKEIVGTAEVVGELPDESLRPAPRTVTGRAAGSFGVGARAAGTASRGDTAEVNLSGTAAAAATASGDLSASPEEQPITVNVDPATLKLEGGEVRAETAEARETTGLLSIGTNAHAETAEARAAALDATVETEPPEESSGTS